MLIKISEKSIVSEAAFRSMFPQVSFPSELTDDVLREHGFAVLNEGAIPIPGVFERVVDCGIEKINGRYFRSWGISPMSDADRMIVAASIRSGMTNEIQRRLDKFAQDHGYDNILSLCTYATSSVERFRCEGQRGVDLRDQTWAIADQITKDVNAGKRQLPLSFAEIESEFPALTM